MGVGKMRKDEKGSVIVEATYVFPIVFFVIFFLLFMGDAYYLQSQVDSLTNQAAVLAAADCADPIAAEIQAGTFNTNTKPQLYRYIFTGGYMQKISDDLKDRLEKAVGQNAGFFAGMESTNINCSVKYKGSIIEPTCIATSKCDIRLPIRFIFADDNITISVTAKAEAPVVDMSDFIQNIEMIGDYMESTGLDEKLNDMKEKLSGFINSNKE